MHPTFWPYLVGLIPILLARCWPARIVALFFGFISVGLGVRHVWSINNSPDVITAVQGVSLAVIGALVIAVISTVVTFFVDKKYGNKV